MYDRVVAMIASYVEKDPTKFCTYEEFLTAADTLRTFCQLRAQSVRAQLDGALGSESGTQDESAMINADALQISDMGSMGMGGGRESFPGNSMPEMPEQPSVPSDETQQGTEEG